MLFTVDAKRKEALRSSGEAKTVRGKERTAGEGTDMRAAQSKLECQSCSQVGEDREEGR